MYEAWLYSLNRAIQSWWCARQDLNLHARAMEPKGDVTLVKGLKPPECFIIALQNTYQQSEFSGIN